MKLFLLALAVLSITACDKKNSDGTYNRATEESKANKDIQNKNLEEKASKMENDLQRRFRFYAGVSHNYSGLFKIRENSYQMNVEIFSTRHSEESDRVRNLEEIQDDLNNLFLNARVVIRGSKDSIGAKGCVFEKVRPDITNGIIQLISSDCPNRYTLYLGSPKASATQANALLDGRQKSVNQLLVNVSSQFNDREYNAVINKR
ncbi:MAG: hypothetical protein V4596_01830 [Bdellovibrionota bacterium]